MPHRHRRPSAAGVLLSACLAAAVLAGCTVEEPRGTDRVERVLDGETLVLSRLGRTRLIGSNAPEEGRCGANAATRFTRRQLDGKRVKYELGVDSKDRWGRRLAYLSRDGTMHNLALVEEGYATAHITPPNNRYANRFEAAEEEAKRRRSARAVFEAAEEEAELRRSARARSEAAGEEATRRRSARAGSEAAEEEAKRLRSAPAGSGASDTQEEGRLVDCAQKRREGALSRARARERAERAEQAERLARRLRAVERRAREEQPRERGGDGPGGSGPGGSGSGGSEARKKLRRGERSDPEPIRRSEERRRIRRRAR